MAKSASEIAVAHRTTEVHGGDDVHLVKKLVCDFSVTTNGIGPVPASIAAVRNLLGDILEVQAQPQEGATEDHTSIISAPTIEHYPSREAPELRKATAEFMRPDEPECRQYIEECIMFGNGASELIDLVARMAPPGKYSVSPHSRVQYREYERACKNSGHDFVENAKEAIITCLVNPTNPTGDFVERDEMECWIRENAEPGSWVIVDESMLFWASAQWHQRGVSDRFVKVMLEMKDVKVFRVYSWTKIFSCTGLRIGSIVCPSLAEKNLLESRQVPWSVNAIARAYLQAAVQSRDYIEQTWEYNVEWRAHMKSELTKMFPAWDILGREFTSWLWIDTKSELMASQIYHACLEAGVPIRHAKAGYGLPTFVRMAVRRPSDFVHLYQALLPFSNSVANSQCD